MHTDIKKDIQNNKILLYMKGTPDAPSCGFSAYVCAVLKALNVRFDSRNVLEDPNLRQAIKDFSNWPTIPQLYIDEEFIGGCDIVKTMYEDGSLQKLLREKGLTQNEQGLE